MDNTALGAKNTKKQEIVFISEAHEKRTNSSSKMNSSFQAQLLGCFNTSHRLFRIIG